LHGEALADVARPCSPEKSTPDLVDFDDGISAISSHTLEEMERRRVADPIREDVEWKPPFQPAMEPRPISRNESINTRKTNATEESFQKFMQYEAKYWNAEVNRERGRQSMEERARRLRELSRSRSRSDGTGVSYFITS
jgi:hypothetical protein